MLRQFLDAQRGVVLAILDGLAATPLDAPPKVRDPRLDVTDLRWVLLHMIEETARHAGHADLLREAIDGSTGE